MIEKLEKHNTWGECLEKLNKLIDTVNELQTAKDVMFNRIDRLNDAMCDMRKRITALEDQTYHKAEPEYKNRNVKQAEKCPYCNKTLHCGATLKSDEYLVDLYQCSNPECESTEFLVGCKEFWDILGQHIRTRKALDVANNAIDEMLVLDSGKFIQEPAEMWKIAKSAKDKITALKQKDVK